MSNNVNNYETELTVAEGYEEDVGRGIARVGPNTLLTLSVSPGDVCLIIGDWKCPVTLWRADKEDWEDGNVLLDEFTRVTTQAELNTQVTIKPVESTVTEEIILNWYRGFEFDLGKNAVAMIKKQLVKRPVSLGDVIPVVVETEGIDYMPFVIADIQPDGVSVIEENTDIKINTA